MKSKYEIRICPDTIIVEAYATTLSEARMMIERHCAGVCNLKRIVNCGDHRAIYTDDGGYIGNIWPVK
jgi:hypothetical protein